MKSPRLRREFERRYGRRPRGVLGHLWDVLYDSFILGWMLGYDAANKAAKKRGGK